MPKETGPAVWQDKDGSVVPSLVIDADATPIGITTSGAGATAAQSLGGKKAFRVTADGAAWIRFGGNSVAATADADASILFLEGTEPVLVTGTGISHVSIMRVGGTDVTVQLVPYLVTD